MMRPKGTFGPNPGDYLSITVNKWGAAAILAGIESLLEHDGSLRMDQRLTLRGIAEDIRSTLKEDAPSVML